MKKSFRGFLFAAGASTISAHAFAPDLGNLVRHQPMMLKASPQAFIVSGSIEMNNEKFPYTLTWAGPNEGYSVEFKSLPASIMTGARNTLTLLRGAGGCSLLIGSAPHPCMNLRFWGDFEFSANPDRAAASVSTVGIAPNSELVFQTINSKEIDPKTRVTKVKPALKTIQGTFLSLFDYLGPGGSEIGFDSITFAPLYARFPHDGMMWEITASPTFYLEKEENRNNIVVSQKLEVSEGTDLIATVRREPLRRTTKPTLPTPNARGSVAEVPLDRFTDRGKNFLKVLFLTH